ncbi:hypothetical protein IPM09_05150 [Candidatus Saccharibacteria bacterium]|nr:MAG: hypothetical protein IPM09_05150 [Candidatus Saccharibacteria bacterium]
MCSCEYDHHRKSRRNYSGSGNAVYSLGVLGALVYYISTASGFWVGVLGVFKAIVWPAFVVYEIMKMLQM